MTRQPSVHAMDVAKHSSDAAIELDYIGMLRLNYEAAPLRKGDRVFLLTVEGEFPGTVLRRWEFGSSHDVIVDLDGGSSFVALHRSLFRAFSVLDHLSSL